MLPTRPGSVARWRVERERHDLRKASCWGVSVGDAGGACCWGGSESCWRCEADASENDGILEVETGYVPILLGQSRCRI